MLEAQRAAEASVRSAWRMWQVELQGAAVLALPAAMGSPDSWLRAHLAPDTRLLATRNEVAALLLLFAEALACQTGKVLWVRDQGELLVRFSDCKLDRFDDVYLRMLVQD